MKYLVLVFLLGCAGTKISKEASKVKVINPDQLSKASSCDRLKKIKASTQNPMLIDEEQVTNELVNQLKQEAHNNKGNLVITRQKITISTGAMSAMKVMKGVVYKCPQSTLDRLHSSEDF